MLLGSRLAVPISGLNCRSYDTDRTSFQPVNALSSIGTLEVVNAKEIKIEETNVDCLFSTLWSIVRF